MSKFFYDNNLNKNANNERLSDSTKRLAKLGTAERPLSLSVQTKDRKLEIEAVLNEKKLFASIQIEPDAEENIVELDGVLNKPKTMVFEKTPKRNEPCSCGSGKKYKKCCGVSS